VLDRFSRRILSHLSDTRYQPRTIRELSEDLSIGRDDFHEFRLVIKQLAEQDRVILGETDTVALPPPGREMVGVFRKHERGFGFLIPDDLQAHGDLFIPPGETLDALTGDRVRAKVRREHRRGAGAKSPYIGRIVEILQRSDRKYVGTLVKKGSRYLVEPDGGALGESVIINDPHAKNAKPGDKVVIDLVSYSDNQHLPSQGVILEVLGEGGEPDVETLAIMRAFGLKEGFPDDVMEDARQAVQRLEEADNDPHREDLRDLLILTIDPPDAKDFDDAISLVSLDPAKQTDDAAWELGVHIADVAHFVETGSALDKEAYDRGNSTYLPRRVVPMLPEQLSNGVCSLQQGVLRYTKSCFIRYDAKGHVVGERFCKSKIESAKRLTYLEAQALIDNDIREARKHTKTEGKYSKPVIHQLKAMNELAKTIRQRRFEQGMIVLGLPEVELIFDDFGRVMDAQPEDDAFTHTIIEMCMVEANEAAARLFSHLEIPMIRRVHPDPDAHDVGELRQFARVAGFNIPMRPTRMELQQLLEAVRGKPAQHAVHLAVLRTLSKAEYSPQPVGHFALASEDYAHFTSPIRRYPDFVIHRSINAYLDAAHSLGIKGTPNAKQKRQLVSALADDPRVPDLDTLVEFGRHCSHTERNSQEAERELRNYLVLELMATHLGDDFPGIVTGVTGRGVFVQIEQYLVDGFVPISELPGDRHDRYRINQPTGALVAERSGKTITIGDRFVVRIAKVDLARRDLELAVVQTQPDSSSQDAPKRKGMGLKHRQPRGARDGHQKSMNLKQKRGKPSSGKGKNYRKRKR